MAKFVEWANSLLGRFEEQVIASIREFFEDFSTIFRFSKMSHEKSIILLQVIFHFYVFPSPASLSHGQYQHTGENQHRAEHRAKFNSNFEISIFSGDCRPHENASASQRNCAWADDFIQNTEHVFRCSINRLKDIADTIRSGWGMTR
jgi:hypothetical protein